MQIFNLKTINNSKEYPSLSLLFRLNEIITFLSREDIKITDDCQIDKEVEFIISKEIREKEIEIFESKIKEKIDESYKISNLFLDMKRKILARCYFLRKEKLFIEIKKYYLNIYYYQGKIPENEKDISRYSGLQII